MDIKLKLVYFVIDLIIPLAIGYTCRRKQWFDAAFFTKMMTGNVLFIYPFLASLSFWVLRLDIELVWLPILGVVMGAVPGVVAYWLSERKYVHDHDKGSYILAAILSNLVTLGGLSVYILYGETGFAYTQLTAVLQNMLLFLVCFPLAQYYYHKGRSGGRTTVALASLFFNRNQLPVVGLILGIALNYAGVPRPPVFAALFDPLVHIGAWTGLIPVGYSVNFGEMQRYYRSVTDVAPIKFLVAPVCTYGLARLVISDELALNTVLVLASTPTAINAVITVKIHGLNVNIAMAAFVLTTMVYLLLVFPALFVWLTMR